MVTEMTGSAKKTGSRLLALTTAGLLSMGLTATPGAVAFAGEPKIEPKSTTVAEAGYGNLLCKLFPDWRICKKK